MKKMHRLPFFLILPLFTFVISGCASSNKNANLNNNSTSTSIIQNDHTEIPEISSSNNGDPGIYTEYNESLLANAKNGDVVLFFHASWCPTCQALDAHIKRNIDQIPPGLTILKINYDTEKNLRKKYNVTIQHSLIQVDKAGNQITSWVGGNTLGSIEAQLK